MSISCISFSVRIVVARDRWQLSRAVTMPSRKEKDTRVVSHLFVTILMKRLKCVVHIHGVNQEYRTLIGVRPNMKTVEDLVNMAVSRHTQRTIVVKRYSEVISRKRQLYLLMVTLLHFQMILIFYLKLTS